MRTKARPALTPAVPPAGLFPDPVPASDDTEVASKAQRHTVPPCKDIPKAGARRRGYSCPTAHPLPAPFRSPVGYFCRTNQITSRHVPSAPEKWNICPDRRRYPESSAAYRLEYIPPYSALSPRTPAYAIPGDPILRIHRHRSVRPRCGQRCFFPLSFRSSRYIRGTRTGANRSISDPSTLLQRKSRSFPAPARMQCFPLPDAPLRGGCAAYFPQMIESPLPPRFHSPGSSNPDAGCNQAPRCPAAD